MLPDLNNDAERTALFEDNILKLADMRKVVLTMTGQDSLWLMSAAVCMYCGGDVEAVRNTNLWLMQACAVYGVEEGCKIFFEDGRKRGHYIPTWLQPLFIQVITHIQDKYTEDKSNGANGISEG